MKLKSDQLPAQLSRQVLPAYVISGDDPYQRLEAQDQVRRAAKAAGYTERETFHAEAGFDWEALHMATTNLSLFAQRKVVDLWLNNLKLTAAAESVLAAYAKSPGSDTVLLITMPRPDKGLKNKAWYNALEQIGAAVELWPLDRAQTLAWLKRQVQQRGMSASPEALELLLDRVEGNQLAAVQELEKLAVLGVTALSVETLLQQVADSSRYEVFALIDAALLGKPQRVVKIAAALQAADDGIPLILWSIHQELRKLASLQCQLANGASVQQLIANEHLFGPKQARLEKALQRLSQTQLETLVLQCHQVDRVIKGTKAGNSWDELLKLTLAIADFDHYKAWL